MLSRKDHEVIRRIIREELNRTQTTSRGSGTSSRLANLVQPRITVTMEELVADLAPGEPRRAAEMRLAGELRDLGWTRRREMQRGARRYTWHAPAAVGWSVPAPTLQPPPQPVQPAPVEPTTNADPSIPPASDDISMDEYCAQLKASLTRD